jgi:antirestriction protein
MEPKAYISTYGLYNNGYLSGRWFDASELYDAETVWAEIRRLAIRDGVPESKVDDFMGDEIMVQDTDGYPFDIRTDSLDTLAEIGEACEDEHLALKVRIFAEVHGCYGMEPAEIIEACEDLCWWEGTSAEDAAAEMLAENGTLDEIPERLRCYFDYASYARDLCCDGWTEVRIDGTTYLVAPL